jgi:hypothetical protein
LPAEGGPIVVVVTRVGTVVVVVRATADLPTIVVVVDTAATGTPAAAMLDVVVVGAIVATDA